LSGIIVLNKLAARSFHILGVTSHYVIDKSMISISDMKKILGGEANQNPRDST